MNSFISKTMLAKDAKLDIRGYTIYQIIAATPTVLEIVN